MRLYEGGDIIDIIDTMLVQGKRGDGSMVNDFSFLTDPLLNF